MQKKKRKKHIYVLFIYLFQLERLAKNGWVEAAVLLMKI